MTYGDDLEILSLQQTACLREGKQLRINIYWTPFDDRPGYGVGRIMFDDAEGPIGLQNPGGLAGESRTFGERHMVIHAHRGSEVGRAIRKWQDVVLRLRPDQEPVTAGHHTGGNIAAGCEAECRALLQTFFADQREKNDKARKQAQGN